MTELEINRKLALAIGWREDQMEVRMTLVRQAISQAYQAGRDAMREECQQECSAEADEYGVAQRISKAIGELK